MSFFNWKQEQNTIHHLQKIPNWLEGSSFCSLIQSMYGASATGVIFTGFAKSSVVGGFPFRVFLAGFLLHKNWGDTRNYGNVSSSFENGTSGSAPGKVLKPQGCNIHFFEIMRWHWMGAKNVLFLPTFVISHIFYTLMNIDFLRFFSLKGFPKRSSSCTWATKGLTKKIPRKYPEDTKNRPNIGLGLHRTMCKSKTDQTMYPNNRQNVPQTYTQYTQINKQARIIRKMCPTRRVNKDIREHS